MTSLLQAVTELARLAGDEANRFFRHDIAVEIKGDGSPVTAADRAAETVAREWIRGRFPDDGILGEEFGLEKPDAPRRWVLDPIDGTKSFIHGVPLWGTLVAVVEGERVLAGAVYAPPTRELVAAAVGEGAWFNGERTYVSKTATLDAATLLTTDDRFPGRPTRRARWDQLAAASRIVRTWGDCYGYLLLATGRADIMVDDLMNPWDAAAVQVVIEEAGGRFSDFRGQPTAFGGDSIATNAASTHSCVTSSARVETLVSMLDLNLLDFDKGAGLVSVVAQDATTGDVLMVAFADREALEATIRTGEMHYRSRTRGLWHKGGTSGNVQRVVSLTADCDSDAVLARVVPAGPACHTGAITCFTTPGVTPPPADAFAVLDATIEARAAAELSSDAKPSYTRKLLDDRNLRLKKIGEEAAELVLACADTDPERATSEAADLLYHTMVALHSLGIRLSDVREELSRRAGG